MENMFSDKEWLTLENMFSDNEGFVFIHLYDFKNFNTINCYVLIKFDDMFTPIGLGNRPKIVFFDEDYYKLIEKYKEESSSENGFMTNKIIDPLHRYIISETFGKTICYNIHLLKKCLGNSDLIDYLKEKYLNNPDELNYII